MADLVLDPATRVHQVDSIKVPLLPTIHLGLIDLHRAPDLIRPHTAPVQGSIRDHLVAVDSIRGHLVFKETVNHSTISSITEALVLATLLTSPTPDPYLLGDLTRAWALVITTLKTTITPTRLGTS